MIQPFRFSLSDHEHNAQELGRFELESRKWKPRDYDKTQRLRLKYYLDQQEDDVRDQLKIRYPTTGSEMIPVTLPITRHLIDEQARVFLDSSTFDLVDESGKALPADADQARSWDEIKRDLALNHRLKSVNRFARLHSTLFQRFGWSDRNKQIDASIFFPYLVDVVVDPQAPTDIDMAYCVRLEISGPGGPFVTDAKDRVWEFWCGRPDGAFYWVMRGDGSMLDTGSKGENPFKDDDGAPFVPIVAWLDHAHELGLFTLAGDGLFQFNRTANLIATDVVHIARYQGFGIHFLKLAPGATPPRNIELSPARMTPLPDGSAIESIQANPVIGELDKLLADLMKRQAVLNHIPPGAIATDARSAASGIALQIERQPLMELRRDQIETYRGPMERLWKLVRSIHNTYAGGPKFAADTEMRWKPGDLEQPVDPQAMLDQLLIELANDFVTAPEIIAKLRGVSKEEAEQIYQANLEANSKSKADQRAKIEAMNGAIAGAGRAAIGAFRAADAIDKANQAVESGQQAQAPFATPGQQAARGNP